MKQTSVTSMVSIFFEFSIRGGFGNVFNFSIDILSKLHWVEESTVFTTPAVEFSFLF
jgi:hypothetical protein